MSFRIFTLAFGVSPGLMFEVKSCGVYIWVRVSFN